MQVGINVTSMKTSFGGRGFPSFGDRATFQKRPNFPFRAWTISPWSSKNLFDRNRLNKFMQVGMNVKCMHTDFGGRGLSCFGDKISLWSIKVEKFNRSESAQKIYASRGSMSRACTPVLMGVVPPIYKIWLPFKNGKISLSRHGL